MLTSPTPHLCAVVMTGPPASCPLPPCWPQPRMTMARVIKLYRLPASPVTPGLRPLVPGDVPAVTQLLNSYLQKYQLAQVFSEEEVAHWCVRQGVAVVLLLPRRVSCCCCCCRPCTGIHSCVPADHLLLCITTHWGGGGCCTACPSCPTTVGFACKDHACRPLLLALAVIPRWCRVLVLPGTHPPPTASRPCHITPHGLWL
jgi:hypothetical protein